MTTLTQEQAWIGGFKDEGTWKWTDGSTWSYTNWGDGQPDNSGGRQDAVQMNFGEVGKWDDITKNYYEPGLPFICQKLPG